MSHDKDIASAPRFRNAHDLMASFHISGGRSINRFGRWLAGASTLIYIWSRLVPWSPPTHHGEIEDSYIQFLHTAFAEHLQFGREVVFTFGPWGFLYGGYHPATHLLSVVTWMALSVVLWWTGWKVARHFSKNEFFAWLWVMCFTAIAGLTIAAMTDARLKAFIVLLWLLHFFVEERPFTAAQTALVVALGLLSLVKVNPLIAAALVLGVISVNTVLRKRSYPWLLLIYAGSLLFFWIIAGQSLNGLIPFLSQARGFARNFTEAAMLTGPGATAKVACYLFLSGLIFVTVGYAGRGRDKLLVPLSLTGLGVLVFTTFKHGYVRLDFHDAAATLELLLVSLASLSVAWPAALARNRRAALAAVAPTILVTIFTVWTFDGYYQDWLPSHLGRTLDIRSVLGPVKLFLDRSYLLKGYESYLADIRRDNPLPAIDGPVDTYPGNGGAILAHGLAYRPRPVLQSLAAATPELAKLNAAFLTSDRAPENIVFQIAPVDSHYPSLEDGRSWPELLTRYDVRRVEWPFLLLKRSATPRAWHSTLFSDLVLNFGDLVSIPPTTNAPIWATLEIDPTVWGRIVSVFYKPPVLSMTVTTADGRPATYRLIPGMSRGGFLLSPLIQQPIGFGVLASENPAPDLADKELTSLMVSADTYSRSSACYRSPMRLRLYWLEFPRQVLGNLAGFSELRSVARVIQHATNLRSDYRPEAVYRPSCGSVLQVAPDSAIQLARPGTAKLLSIGFGILGRGGAEVPKTGGVHFRVSAMGSEGELVPLWSQQIEAREGESAAGAYRAKIPLSHSATPDLVLETQRDGVKTNDGLAAYWSEVDFE